MNTLTKMDLAAQLQQRFENIPRKELVDMIETVFDLVVCHFQNGGDKVVLRGFGMFKLGKRNAFVGKHPQNGQDLRFAARKLLSYKPSAEVNRRINS